MRNGVSVILKNTITSRHEVLAHMKIIHQDIEASSGSMNSASPSRTNSPFAEIDMSTRPVDGLSLLRSQKIAHWCQMIFNRECSKTCFVLRRGTTHRLHRIK